MKIQNQRAAGRNSPLSFSLRNQPRHERNRTAPFVERQPSSGTVTFFEKQSITECLRGCLSMKISHAERAGCVDLRLGRDHEPVCSEEGSLHQHDPATTAPTSGGVFYNPIGCQAVFISTVSRIQ